MLDARFLQLYFGLSLNTLQRELLAIAGLLVVYTSSECGVFVFTVQYTEIDLKTREEYLALVPGKTPILAR